MSQLIAFCGSYKCTGILNSRLNKKDFAIKQVKNTIECPDCGNALIWRKPGKNSRTVDIKKRKTIFSLNEKFSTVG